jgi:hypothetical protein
MIARVSVDEDVVLMLRLQIRSGTREIVSKVSKYLELRLTQADS